MKIREAKQSDKITVLQFCQNTFSWGDYIDKVWDYWINEGSLLVIENTEKIIGICHILISGSQIWIEGIRIHPSFRGKYFASQLIEQAEHLGIKNKADTSFMLIDVENSASLSMAKKLGYEIFQTWVFYTIEPKSNTHSNILFESFSDKPFQYIKSWRWLPFNRETEKKLNHNNQIISARLNNKKSFAILTDSEHFDKTMIVTMFSNSFEADREILKYIQHYGYKKNYNNLQILCKEHLHNFPSLEKKITFHLVKKKLN